VTTIVLALALGFSAGILAGLFGIGGGILFVPALLALGLSQLEAEATSLLAILPTVAAGVWRQSGYGNVRWQAAAAVGVGVAESLSEDVLRRLFGILMLVVAAQIAWRAWRSSP
jgi:uncharacterized membrane protein YfcA